MSAVTDSIDGAAPPDLAAIVVELGQLSPLEYDQVREERAKTLKVRVGTLDKEVAQARGDFAEEETASVVEEINPWEQSVTGADLLTEIANTLAKYVYLPKGAPTALAAWVVGTYCMESWSIWPKVLITSPEKRCGKSTLVDVLEAVTFRALVASNISSSAIFRCIDEWQPTLILDEADTFTKDNDELNGIINAGHRRRTAKVIRTDKVADGFVPKAYSVWSPQVIAGIGSQRDTLHDRSIHIEMERKLPDEKVFKVPVDLYEQCQNLRRRCLRWAVDNTSVLKATHIEIPHHGNDRAQDNWVSLVTIGHLVGSGWEEKILRAYEVFQASETEEEDAGIILLRDIKVILGYRGRDKISSADLVEALIAIEDSPWFEWKRGKPLTQNSLSRLLKPFKVKSSTIRINLTTAKGYTRKQFDHAFDRYLSPIPPIQSVTTSQTSNHAAYSDFQSVTEGENVTLSNSRQPSNHAGCDGVTLQNVTTGEEGVSGHGEDAQPDDMEIFDVE